MSYKNLVSAEEIQIYTLKSDWQGLWLLLFNWGLIALAFSLPILWLNAATIFISLVLLANRQLGLAILMHECSHYSLFKRRKLNNWLGKILCAAPVFADLDGYRRYHMRHHKEAGTTTDPDYPNYKNYPITKGSLIRKTLRDLTGLTGIKTLYALMLMNAGILNYDMSYKNNSNKFDLNVWQIVKNLLANLFMPVVVNVMMWWILYLFDNAWLYALWWISYMTIYMFILRVRNAAEHGNVMDLLNKDPRLHARTTYARWWERLIFAPNYVNYHLEHHLRPNIPCYNLKAFHRFLKQKGVLDKANIASGYDEVIRELLGKRDAMTTS
ncbi:fatty acid desaturase family protein [Agarilytica rhodophyticola]|uniref:fatty acid desaturase family protein n=1 Tax=Agarilytica rhodophyticola TaxID=1737490 RepID=UPI000B3485DD|nr:fatty acid desaturase family protein [Agarilytica rhodophyticola]